MSLYLFYFLSFLAALSALMVVFSKNPVHSVLYLIVTFFAIAGHYLLLNAQFLAAVHIVVYAGAIMVLFLYVIMLLNLNQTVEDNKSHISKGAAVVTGGLLLLVLVSAIQGADSIAVSQAPSMETGLVENLGKILYQRYLLPFEVSAILFLAAMVGAVFIGKNENK
jgi:NADH-quinone oxidoreductase subunit J